MSLTNDQFVGLRGIHCMAEYKEQIIKQNQGNPHIEALPNRLSLEAFIDALSSQPEITKEYKKLDAEDRLELVQQIKPTYWLPFPQHYDKYRNLYTMIKIGYQSRNPLHPMYNRQFAIGWDKIFEAGIDEYGANLAGNVHTAQSLVEIGINGSGKSKLYERILIQLFPQVIHHSAYKGRALNHPQVVWLKIECPYNKSVGSLCKSFYTAVDSALGTNYYEKFGEKPGKIDQLAKRMIKVAAQINLGVLVIDEIQKIQKAYSGGEEDMIDFITEIVNTIGIPTILIGSYKALYLFKDSLANTRRGIPDEFMENISGYMLEDSWEWNEFIENLWDMQYTRKATELTPAIKKAMYENSLGIPDFAVKLFMHVQSRAIVRGGDEQMSATLIREVAGQSMKLVQPIFQRIRSGDPTAYKDLEDAKPDWVPLNGYIKEAAHRINVHGNLAEDHARVLQQKNKVEILEKLTVFALRLVQSVTVAEALANEVYEASKGMGDITMMFGQIAQLAMDIGPHTNEHTKKQSDNNPPKIKRTKKIKPPLQEKDLRFVVQSGHKRGLTTEEALEEKGYVRRADDLLVFIS